MVTQSQLTQTSRLTLAERIVDAKAQKGLSFQELVDEAGLSLAIVTATLLGQHALPETAADAVCKRLGLDDASSKLLQEIPLRGSIPDRVPTVSNIYRFHEVIQFCGSSLRALVDELIEDGIISAVNFRLNIKNVDDPEGSSRAFITLDGKCLPYKPY